MPKEYKEAINEALRLYSRGGGGNPIAESLDPSENDFDEAEFETGIRAAREIIAEFAGDNPRLSLLLRRLWTGLKTIKKDS